MARAIFSFFPVMLFSFSVFSADSRELSFDSALKKSEESPFGSVLKERSALLNSSFIHNVGYGTDEDSFSDEEDSGSELPSVPAIKTFIGVPEMTAKKSHNLFPVLVDVKEVLDSGVPPERVGVVFDMDGTITKNADPQGSPNLPVEEREHAVSVLKKLDEWGVFLIISSAWSPFGETLGRIKKVGLGSMIQGDQVQGNMYVGQNFLTYIKQGKATSARVSWSSDRFYRRKDLALFFSDMEKSSILEYMFFSDDSSYSTRSFRDNLKGEHPYPHLAKVVTHYITNPPESEIQQSVLPMIQQISLSSSGAQKITELGVRRKELLAIQPNVIIGDENSENLSTQ